MNQRKLKKIAYVLLGLGAVMVLCYLFWPAIINLMLPKDSRPGRIPFRVETVTRSESGRNGNTV
jgi:hypothetical protein